MDRREFLAKAGLVATWTGIAVTVSSCSDDDAPTSPGGSSSGDVNGVVTGGGHSHSGARVTAAQLEAGEAVVLTLTGSGHTHTVMLSAKQILDIADGETVSQPSSSDDGHMHTVTFN